MRIDLSRFRADLAASLLMPGLDPDSPLYSEGRHAYDWERGTELKPCAPGSYEEFLETFFKRDPAASNDADGVMILVGGIGTGKSTAIRRALHRAVLSERHCSLATQGAPCKRPPRLLVFDFRTDEDHTTDGDSNVDAEKTRFWNQMATEIGSDSTEELDVETEVTKFWSWCLTQKRLLELCPTFHQELLALRPTIRAILNNDESIWPKTQLLRSLVAARERLILERFTKQDTLWYGAFSLRFLGEMPSRACRCTYLFLDNIDQLHPKVQKLAVETAVTLSSVLNARTIIAIRPLTWKRSVHGYKLIRVERHRSPEISQVLHKHIDAFIAEHNVQADDADALRSVAAVMTGKGYDPLLGTLLDATSGYSVRFALRNFSNMFDSPLLRALPSGPTPAQSLRVSDLARAFFFGERSTLIPQSFENLYSVRGDSRVEHWLIKPRILDFICRYAQGTTRINELTDTMSRFGYTDPILLDALNELLYRQRPLVWSEEDSRCTALDSPAPIAATPIGWRYYKELFGEVFYDELCHPADAFGVSGMRAVYEFHLRLTDQDLSESVAAKAKYGAVFYFGLYPSDTPGLAVLHGRRVLRGIRNRIRITENDVYDPRREDWLVKQYRDLLGTRPTLAGLT